jgi:hypothetical protein
MAADNLMSRGADIALDESTAARRRIHVFLALAGAPITGKSGTASVRISKNGTSAAGGGSVTEIDSVNLPGHYYYEATSGEVDTAGFFVAQVTDTGVDDFNVLVNVRKITEDLNDLSAANVNTEADAALSDINLDHLMAVAVTGTDVVDDSVIAFLASKSATADWDTFDNTTDSLEAATDGDFNATQKASINTEADTALTDLRLNELMVLALTGQPTSGSLFGDLSEDDAGTQRFTANALEQAPALTVVLLDTTVATIVTPDTVFTLTAGSDVDDAYTDQVVVLYDADNSNYPQLRAITNYVGSTKTVTVNQDVDFTIAISDPVKILATHPGLQDIAGSLVTVTGSCDVDTGDPLVMNTDLTEATDGHYDGQVVLMRSGALTGRSAVVKQYGSAGGTLTLWSPGFGTETPGVGDDFQLISFSASNPIAIADAVADEALSGHTTAGTLGKVVSDIDADVDQSLSTTESNIRGTDGDDLKDISDQIDGVPAGSTTDLLGAVLSTSPTAGTVEQALLAALGDGLGRWVRDNDKLRIYDPEGEVLLWTFRLTGPSNLPASAREKDV